MGLYNFQARFVPKIEAGEKTHTIRAKRKHPDKPGDLMYLYTGLRTKQARRLRAGGRSDVPVCAAVQDIRITTGLQIIIDGERLTLDEADQFARRDGFQNYGDMMRYWGENLPFNGDVLHWRISNGSETVSGIRSTRAKRAARRKRSNR